MYSMVFQRRYIILVCSIRVIGQSLYRIGANTRMLVYKKEDLNIQAMSQCKLTSAPVDLGYSL